MASTASIPASKYYWPSQLLFWGFFGLINLAYALLWPPFKAINITVTILATAALLTNSHLLKTMFKTYASDWSIYASIACALVLIPIAGFTAQAIVYILIQLLMLVAPGSLEGMVAYNWRNYMLYGMNSTMTLALWSIIYLTVVQFRGRRQTEIAYWKSQTQLRDMELQFLHNQINSHFLFNAMNNVRSLILENQELARDRLTQLANLLRATLQVNEQETISLSEELALVRAYLDLESLQLEHRLTVDYTIDEDIIQCQVPPMLVQTLVENAVRHGIAQRPEGGTIVIQGSLNRKNDKVAYVEISVINPLGNQTAKDGHGIGVNNARQRLEKVFGPQATLELNIVAENHITSLRVPM